MWKRDADQQAVQQRRSCPGTLACGTVYSDQGGR